MKNPYKWLFACASLAVAALCLTVGQVQADNQAAAPAPTAQVQVTALKRGTLPRTLMVYGTVQSSVAAREAVVAPVAARVAAIKVRLGEAVAKGAPLIGLVPTPATTVAYAQATSELKVASDALMRTRTMYGQHLATAQQVSEAEKAASDARASLSALEAQGAAGARIVHAPYAATVTALSTSVGSIVDVGGALLELARPSDLVLAANVAPLLAPQIAPGNPARITPIGGDATVAGRVSMRGGAVDTSSGLVPVEVALPGGALMPGQTASAVLTTGTLEGFIVPHSAVLLNDEGDTYVVQEINGVARKVSVIVLGRQDDQDAIDGHLTENAPVVLAGNYQVDDGMKLQIVPAPTMGKDDTADKGEK